MSATQQNWFSRNWKWFVPALVGSCIAVPVGIVALVVLLVFSAIKNLTPYKVALREVSADQRVVTLIGEPIHAGWWVAGSSEVSGPSGSASLMFPVSGPLGKANIFVEASKAAGVWSYRVLSAESENIDWRLNLLPVGGKQVEW